MLISKTHNKNLICSLKLSQSQQTNMPYMERPTSLYGSIQHEGFSCLTMNIWSCFSLYTWMSCSKSHVRRKTMGTRKKTSNWLLKNVSTWVLSLESCCHQDHMRSRFHFSFLSFLFLLPEDLFCWNMETIKWIFSLFLRKDTALSDCWIQFYFLLLNS